MSAQITVTVAGSERSVAEQTTAGELFEGDRAVVVARVNGQLRDLFHVVADGDVVEPVTVDSEDGLAVLRHSTAHVLAQAVQQLHADAKLGIGPPVRDGFYYDFDVETPFHPDDLKALEKAMQKIINEGQTFVRRVVTDADALEELKDEPYKCELVGLKGGNAEEAAEGAGVEVGAGELTIYDNVRRDGTRAWGDLCRGPHIPSTKLIGNAFKLMRVAAAYWRGSEKNPQLQRIYGTAWPTKDDLKAYLDRLAEAERRDHRRLGAELDLFSFPDRAGLGPARLPPQGRRHQARDGGLRPRAGTSRRASSTSAPRTSPRRGSSTPPATCRTTPTRMFPPMERRGRSTTSLKAMSCPMHNLIYKSRRRSYRELPLRLFEFGSVYRDEKSGVRPRPDPRARYDPGRLALLRHRGAGRRPRSSTCSTSSWACSRTSASTTTTSSCRPATTPRTSSSAATSSGRPRRRSSRTSRRPPASSSCPTRVAPPTTARRSRSRPATPSGAPGRCRRSSTTSTSPSASASSTRPPTARVSSRS